jgi:putative ABC transport system permease protein
MRGWWRRERERDLAREVRGHLELEAREQRESGLLPQAADYAARRAFGNTALVMEDVRTAWGWNWLADLRQDVRYGLRAMRQSPGFTVAAVLTLALGIGANTAIFSLIDSVLLRSLPVHDPASLYFVENAGARGAAASPPYPCLERFRSLAKSFSAIAAYASGDFGIRIAGPIEQVDGARVSGNYHGMLGLTPLLGRLLTVEDEQLNPPVAVISYAFWQRRFGGSPDAIGKTFTLDEHRFTIVGVAPREFYGMAPGHSDDVTMPITISGRSLLGNTGSWWFQAVGRLRPGVTAERARAEIDPIFQAFMTEFPQPKEMRRDYFASMRLTPASRGLDDLRKRFSRPLWALMAVVGLVLLIACANITNLLLARAAKREREFAIRVAIGAGRTRLFRQLLVETGLLFAAGAASGIALAWWAARGITAFFSTGAHPIVFDAHWDWSVLGFTAGLSLLATLIFGAAPVLSVVRADPHSAMNDGGRNTASRGRLELGRFLVAFQVALSLVLLVGAALFLRTLHNLYGVDAGFHADQVALITLHLPDPTYRAAPVRGALWDRLLEEVRALPGVRSAGLSSSTPLDNRYMGVRLEVPGFQSQSLQDSAIGMNLASDGYFATLGTRVLRGREFSANDRSGTPDVALLNENAVRHFFQDRDPIGVIVKLNGGPYRVVGVVQDVKDSDLRRDAGRLIYVSTRQHPERAAWQMLNIRTSLDPQTLLAAAQSRIRGLGPDIHIVRTGTLAAQVDESLLQERVISSLAAAFGLLALLLSAVGLYGVLAYSVARRTSEIGIRMALGAPSGKVTWSILRQTLALVAIGMAAGIPAAVLLAGLAKKLLYGVTPADPVTLMGSAAVLAAVALLASFLPAHRAGRIDPLVALRHE